MGKKSNQYAYKTPEKSKHGTQLKEAKQNASAAKGTKHQENQVPFFPLYDELLKRKRHTYSISSHDEQIPVLKTGTFLTLLLLSTAIPANANGIHENAKQPAENLKTNPTINEDPYNSDAHAVNANPKLFKEQVTKAANDALLISKKLIHCNKKTLAFAARDSQGDTYVMSPPQDEPKNKCDQLENYRQDAKKNAIDKFLSLKKKDALWKQCPEDTFRKYAESYIRMNTIKKSTLKTERGNCDEHTDIFLSSLIEHSDPAVRSLPKAKIELSSVSKPSHVCAVVFNPDHSPSSEVEKSTFKQLAKTYPDAMLVDLWNHMIIPLGAFNDKKTLKKAIRENLSKFAISEVPNEHLLNIGDYYTGFSTCTTHMLPPEPSEECLNKFKKYL